MFDYTAIDFETANSFRGSPCSVGLVRVRDGHIVDQRHWLMRPPAKADWFDSWNVTIHGITPDMVQDAPRWQDLLPGMMDFIGNDVVVAHNAGFDIGVIRYACAVDNIAWPELRFLDTLVLSRRAIPLPSYRLPYVAQHFGAPLHNHHDALADAKAVVGVIDGLAASRDAENLEALADSIGVQIGHMSAGIYIGSVVTTGSSGKLCKAELNPDADPDGYLYGRVIVFTGKLMSMTRQVAWDECSKVGAIAELTSTKRTNVLVVGDINPAVLRPGSILTGKARKAFQLQDKGQEIEVMTEDDFLNCLTGNRLKGAEILLADTLAAATKPATGAAAAGSNQRTMPLSLRPAPELPASPKPPRPLRRTPAPTDQLCSTTGCNQPAAFKTRTKPTWCTEHIAEIQRAGGLLALESFTHPNDYQMTECQNCAVQAHYRFNYTLEKNPLDEQTCRACYWRTWAVQVRATQGPYARREPVPYDEAQRLAEKHGYDYLGPLTAPSLPDDPHHVRCQRCTKVNVERLADVTFGCTCAPR
ncbi:exonuclease domain-containing protein [Nocardioides sp.]|uniref:exonuclease domain-containing protein n=1 Tax=Nocardioides sp. TaxID=35761 RepID=UPI0019BB0F66|nr:exonuclease domain-containing protein [Nocardioides sp.]MBC7275681.1 3'-5' exoribonuclease [Nocardioides sp.]